MKISQKQNFRQTKLTDSNFRITKKISIDKFETELHCLEKISKKQELAFHNRYINKKKKRKNLKIKSKHLEKSQNPHDIFKLINFSINHEDLVIIKEVFNLSQKKKIFRDSEEFEIGKKKEIDYLKDLKAFLEKNKINKFMMKHFPESYTFQNFYGNIQKLKNRHETFILKIPNLSNKNFSYLNNNNLNFYEFNEFPPFPFLKKIWSPSVLNNYQIKFFLVVIKKFWYHEYIEWTHEGALEFLMINKFNVIRTIRLIRTYDISFLIFIHKYCRIKTYSILNRNYLI